MDVQNLYRKLQDTLTKLDGQHGSLSVAIEHLDSGEVFTHNADVTCYAASVIKAPIMAAVYHQAAQGQFRLSDTIEVNDEDMVTGSGILQNLTPPVQMSVKDVTLLMIIESDNTATNILADLVGQETIATLMRGWGLEKTAYYNKLQVIPHPYPERRNTICAREMTAFFAKMARGEIVSWDACRRMIAILKDQKFNDLIPALFPYDESFIGAVPKWEFAHKTGFVTGVEHDSGILYFPGATFAVSVFAQGVTDRRGIQQDIAQIGKVLYDEIHAK